MLLVMQLVNSYNKVNPWQPSFLVRIPSFIHARNFQEWVNIFLDLHMSGMSAFPPKNECFKNLYFHKKPVFKSYVVNVVI